MDQAVRCAPGAHMPVLLVRLADGMTKLAEQAVLGIRHVYDELPARLDDPEEFVYELGVRVDMLQKIHDDHTLKFVILKASLPTIDLKHIIVNKLADRVDGPVVQVRALPLTPCAPEQVADYTIIAANIETMKALRMPKQRRDLS